MPVASHGCRLPLVSSRRVSANFGATQGALATSNPFGGGVAKLLSRASKPVGYLWCPV